VQEKTMRVEQNFILDPLYIILSLEVGRKSKSLPVSNGLWTKGENGGELMLILRYPKSLREEFLCNLTRDL
jgi:hypothetical protein